MIALLNQFEMLIRMITIIGDVIRFFFQYLLGLIGLLVGGGISFLITTQINRAKKKEEIYIRACSLYSKFHFNLFELHTSYISIIYYEKSRLIYTLKKEPSFADDEKKQSYYCERKMDRQWEKLYDNIRELGEIKALADLYFPKNISKPIETLSSTRYILDINSPPESINDIYSLNEWQNNIRNEIADRITQLELFQQISEFISTLRANI